MAELQAWKDDGRPLIILDVREETDFERGTIPGAESFSQGPVFLNVEACRTKVKEMAMRAVHSELVLFANTGGTEGMAASRDRASAGFDPPTLCHMPRLDLPHAPGLLR